ncbi:MAG: mechanosensitive ion channel domain-containing protein [Bacteroidota bacterium]
MNLLLFIASGLLLFSLFRLLNRISWSMHARKVARKNLVRFLPLAELVIWIVYVFWGVHLFFGHYAYYDLIILVMAVLLIAGLAWYVFRDFLAGVLIKTEKVIEPGQVIKTPFVEGRIKTLGIRSMKLINNEGEVVKIPYSRLNNDLFVLPPEDTDSLPHHVTFLLPLTMEADKAGQEIFEYLMAMPQVVTPHPVIKTGHSHGNDYQLHVSFYTHLRSQGFVVQQKLQAHIDAKKEKLY